ncbi:MAG TPA: VanW family protein [Candidatus Ventricola intestinavium]|nr:VanW family protein [Candidatus Ventricola intestinavium]
MKKRIFLLFFTLLTAWAAMTALAEEIVYTGTVTKDMTIREKKSTSAKKLGSVEAGGLINIIEYGDTWTKVDQDGVVGYVLSKNVEDLAAAAGYNDEAEALYVGVATKELTIRKTKSKSAQRMHKLAEGETVYILELGEEWYTVVKQGVHGYVLADPIAELAPAHEGIEIPEEYQPEPPFEALYTATADVNLSIRKEADAESTLVGTVYEDEDVEVMDPGGEWARVRKGDVVGYVRADHLRYYMRTDPYGPYVPGVVFYPYAAHVTQPTDITDSETGELLRTVPAGTILVVSALDSDMAVTLPYDRVIGRIQATANLEMEAVAQWDEAQQGDLIAVFSTYYDPQQETQEQIGRLHNIMQGVERLNDVIIPAGQKFYFNDYCAPYTKANGYELGPIINYVSSEKLGYGGGICQVSTTLYDAILQIPIDVIKWQVHSSYGISYAPLDMDAAVGAGNIDLRLQNTLPYDVRLALQATGGVLTVRVYRAS